MKWKEDTKIWVLKKKSAFYILERTPREVRRRKNTKEKQRKTIEERRAVARQRSRNKREKTIQKRKGDSKRYWRTKEIANNKKEKDSLFVCMCVCTLQRKETTHIYQKCVEYKAHDAH